MNKTLVLFAHPYFEHSQTNARLIQAYQNLEQITFRDLYEDYPDFNIAAFKERKRLVVYDTLIFHFPLIWFGMPPLLKLWIDEVFDMKWITDEHSFNPLNSMKAHIIVTAGGTEQAFSKEGLYRHSVQDYMITLEQSLAINNISVEEIVTIHNADKLTYQELEDYYQQIRTLAKNS